MSYRQQQENEEEYQQKFDYVETLLMQGDLDYEYCYFLEEKYPEEVPYKDRMIEVIESGLHDYEFCEWIVEKVGIHHSDFMKYVEQMEGTLQ